MTHLNSTTSIVISYCRNCLTLCIALVVIVVSAGISIADDTNDSDARRAEVVISKAMKAAASTNESLKLIKEVKSLEALLLDRSRKSGVLITTEYDDYWLPEFSATVLDGVDSRVGGLTRQLNLMKLGEEIRRDLERTAHQLSSHLAATAWSTMTDEEQALCIAAKPDFVRLAGQADRLPTGPPGSRPQSWIHFQPMGAAFNVWMPSRPVMEVDDENNAFEVEAADTGTRFSVDRLNGLRFLTFKLRAEPALLRDLAEGSVQKISTGQIKSSEACEMLGSAGHEVSFTFKKDGIARSTVMRIVATPTAVFAFSVDQVKDGGDPMEVRWFFDSIGAVKE